MLGVVGRPLYKTRITDLILPNYQTTKPPSSSFFFTSITTLILKHASSLEHIEDTRRLSHSSNRCDLPSWAVDYSSRPEISDLALLYANIYHAAANTASNYPCFEINGRILKCYGANFQRIKEIRDVSLDQTRVFYDFLHDLLQFWISLP